MISLTSFPENLFAISSIHNEDRFLGMRIDDPDHSEVVLFVGHHGVEFDGAMEKKIKIENKIYNIYNSTVNINNS